MGNRTHSPTRGSALSARNTQHTLASSVRGHLHVSENILESVFLVTQHKGDPDTRRHRRGRRGPELGEHHYQGKTRGERRGRKERRTWG